jgi:tRNA G10  N-methylase Trm11
MEKPVQIFIPGKNWKLSLAELLSSLHMRKINFEVNSISRQFFAIETDTVRGGCDIERLGGFIKIGKIRAKISTEHFKEAFIHNNKEPKKQISRRIGSNDIVKEILEKAPRKIVFGVSVYCSESSLNKNTRKIQRFIGSTIKRELESQGRKSKFMGFPKERRNPQLSHIEVLKKNLVENKAEILVCIDKEYTYIVTSSAVHNPFEFQKRDIDKPVQRKIFAIPPRLARIIVNLAACKEGNTLLDPFCGVGTILQEALLSKSKAIGVDINRWCVEATNRNLNWVRKEYSLKEAEFRVIQGDVAKLSQKVGWQQVDCMATEPDLGPALRQVPTTAYAIRILKKLEPLYFTLLEEAWKVLREDGRIVFSSPYIRTRSGKPVSMDVKEVALKIGFHKVLLFEGTFFQENIVSYQHKLKGTYSFIDMEKRHKIGREIHVFQK